MKALTMACRALIVSSVAIVLSGCAAEDNSRVEAKEPALGTILQVRNEGQVTRLTSAFLPSSSEIIHMTHFQTDAVNRCFAEHGVSAQREYVPAELSAFTNRAVRNRAIKSSLWGFFDTTNAPRHGYQNPPEYGEMLMEKHSGGDVTDIIVECRHRAESGAPGNADSLAFTGEEVLPERGPPVPVNDSRYVAAVATWSTCMKERGFDYPDPRAAISDRQWQTGDAREVATATADIECKISTNLVGIALAVQTAYDKQYIDTHQEALAQFRSDLDTYLRSATQSAGSVN